jgi:hypothetical protein
MEDRKGEKQHFRLEPMALSLPYHAFFQAGCQDISHIVTDFFFSFFSFLLYSSLGEQGRSGTCPSYELGERRDEIDVVVGWPFQRLPGLKPYVGKRHTFRADQSRGPGIHVAREGREFPPRAATRSSCTPYMLLAYSVCPFLLPS